MMVVVPIGALVTYYAFRLMEKSSARAQQAYGTANEIVLESIAAIRTVAAYTIESFRCSQYSAALEFPLRKGIQEVGAQHISMKAIHYV
jgi:ABC-type bacteriocin/lantibiotic exporter with double-glycine peptidase domain